jgi:hypothetical protein
MSLLRSPLRRVDNDNAAFDQSSRHGDVTIHCYENAVPSFAEMEIDRLYGHLLCSLSNFAVARDLNGASTYVARKDGVAIAVFLFRRDAHEVKVISEFITLDQDAIHLFADYIFTRYPAVKMVSFSKIHAVLRDIRYPCHAVTCTEDIVVSLPPTVEEYRDRLGKNTRRNIKRYTSSLQKDFPSFRYQVQVGTEISEQHLRDIVQLNRTRMANKSIVSRIDEEETQWIVDFAKRCGIVGIATIDGRVCGGAIGFRIGENYFMHVIAHDPQYNEYSLGFLCYYWTICEGILRGGKRFHLLLGRYEYKYRLLGETQEIANVHIYRNRLVCVRYGGRIVKTAFDAGVLQAKQWLLEAERRNDRPSRLAARMVNILRTVKRAGWRGLILRKSA